jgi:hypothetical protein
LMVRRQETVIGLEVMGLESKDRAGLAP